MFFQAKQKGLGFYVDVCVKNQDMMVVTDATRLKQILLNLAGNALKFTNKGEIRISVNYDLQSADCLLFSVKDTGVGIPQNIISNLFKVFAT